jgi:hypothetical protein
MRRSRVASSLFFIFFLTSQPIHPCIHKPVDYKGSVTETTKEAFIFHDGVNAHLIHKTTIKAEGPLPSDLAWVIPIPSLPLSYEQLDGDIFHELFNLTRPIYRSTSLRGTLKEAPRNIIFHQKEFVGDYEIQPIEIASELAGDELNGWLSVNGFRPVPLENQKFYLHRGQVFLALRFKRLSGENAEIKPLHIVYKDSRILVPVKFSNSSIFDLVLYTFTQRPPIKNALDKYYLTQTSSREIKGSEWRETSPELYRLIGNRDGFITRFDGKNFNAVGHSTKTFNEDPFLLP